MKDLIDLTTESEDTDNAAIDIISDSEDEDLKRAIAMSLQDQHALETATEVQDVSPQPQQLSVTQTSGLAGLDRKAMEAERLARLKRKRGLDEDHETQIASRSRQVSPPARKRGVPHREALSKLPSSMTVRPSVSTSNPFDFSHPKVLLTSHPSRHTASVLTSISLRDIVSAPEPGFDLKSVLLSSFMADFDWLLPHFDTRNTSFVIILHAQNAKHRQALQDDFAGVPNVRLVLPKCMGGSGNMHSKVMLLFFKSVQAGQENEICRIVITSANLTPTDWGVGGHMENVVFTVDVPKKDRGDDSTQTQFELSFIQQLRAMEVPEKVLQKLESFDLRATEQMSFVSSISQSLVVNPELDQKAQRGALQKVSSGNKNDTVFESTTDGEQKLSASRARVGLLALSDAVSALGLTISKSDAAFPPRLDFITSSLGNLSAAFVRQLYSAACGTLDPQCVLATKSKSKKLVTDHEDKSIDDLVQQNLRIYFPSDKTVRESKGGSMSAGTICFQRKWWNDNEIIRNSLYDCIGRRSDGILMHSKILYVRFAEPKTIVDSSGISQTYAGYAYVGSGNLSESAWGRVTVDTKTKEPKMTCRNWESGVVIPLHASKLAAREYGRSNMPQTSHNLHSQIADTENPASLTEAKYVQGEQESRLDHSGGFKGLSLNDTFSSMVPVPIRDDQRLVDKGLEPWFFRD